MIDEEISIYRVSLFVRIPFAVKPVACESDVINNCMRDEPRRSGHINVECERNHPRSFFDLRFALSSDSTCSSIASSRSGGRFTTERNNLPTRGLSVAIRVALS